MWKDRDKAEVMEEIWNKLYLLREKTKKYSELEWQKHTNPVTGKFLDSIEGFMCGIIIRTNKKVIAELHILWMPWINSFEISSMIKNHKSKNISGEDLKNNFVEDDPVKNLKLLFLQFEKHINQLISIIDEGKDLKKNLPTEWYGENVYQQLIEAFKKDPAKSLKFIFRIIFSIISWVIILVFLVWGIFFSDATQELRDKFWKVFESKEELKEIYLPVDPSKELPPRPLNDEELKKLLDEEFDYKKVI